MRLIIVLLLPALMLSSCSPVSYQQDDEIDPNLRAEMDTLSVRLLHACADNNYKEFVSLCSDDLKRHKDLRKGMSSVAASIGEMSKRYPFIIKYRYYTQLHGQNKSVVLNRGDNEEQAFNISYTSGTRKSFVVAGSIADSVQEIAFVSIWGNYNGKWKLNVGQAGMLKAFGKNAVDWYYRARQQYGDNALVDAANSMTICQALQYPAGQYWRYKLDDDMTGLIAQIKSTGERDYSFPIEVDAVKTSPRIFGTSTKVFSDGYYPVIAYATRLNLSDTAALSRECDSLNAHIGDVFNNLDHYNKLLIYRAFARVPRDSSDQVLYYGFVKKSSATWFY